ncbi:MAG: hypothetical protein ABI602_04100 [Candidatus Saccharibacteria bacterium]
MATPNKDTIYIDIDDEITGIIDKIRSSNGKVIALVLPKRASVFQSIVNMKLLKRSADDVKKHIVLITSEAGLLPLAGAVGLHVAKSLQTKPEIPAAPQFDDHEETIEEAGDMTDSLPLTVTDGNRPIGELAGLSAAATDDVETLEIDDEPAGVAAVAAAPSRPKKNKKLAIPNFERFRLLLVGGVLLLIALIVGLVFALNVLPKAAITISTNASDVNVGLNVNLDTAAQTLDLATATVPSKQVQSPKTTTQSTPATGQKNTGDKAKGSVTITNCSADSSTQLNIPAGTGVSANGLTYITQESASLTTSSFSGKGACQSFNGITSKTVSVTAQAGGANYNMASDTVMKVAGFTSAQAKTSSDISGGTDNIVKVVSQTDIDTATQKMATQDSSGVKQDLQSQLSVAGYTPIAATFNAGTPVVTSSASAGSTVDTVTVTQVTTYTMLGAKQADLKTLIDNDVKKQIDTSKQSILSEGLADAKYKVNSATTTGAQVALQTIATAGPDLNVADIKQQSAGKKGGDIKRLLQATPGVTDVNVKLSPFWVQSVPKKITKITVTIAKPTAPTPSSNANKP